MSFSKGQSYGMYISKVMAIILLATSLGCFVAMYLIIRKGAQLRKRTQLKEHEKSYNVFQEGLGSSNNWITTYWKILVIGRWTFTNIILIVVKDYNQFQIVILLIISFLF